MDKVRLVENAFRTLKFNFYAKEFLMNNGEFVICIYDSEKLRDSAKKPNKKEEIQIYSELNNWFYKIRNLEGKFIDEEIKFEDFKEALYDLVTNITSQFIENVIFSEEIVEELSEFIPIDESGNCLN